ETRLLDAATAPWPLAAHAQDSRSYRIAVLNTNARGSPVVTAIFDELRRNGLVEGRNLAFVPMRVGSRGHAGKIDDDVRRRLRGRHRLRPHGPIGMPLIRTYDRIVALRCRLAHKRRDAITVSYETSSGRDQVTGRVHSVVRVSERRNKPRW